MSPTALYFAYGSNLRAAQMDRLCPGHQFLAAARLDGYRLAFTLPDLEWQGGVADLLAAPRHCVWGALYRIDATHLAALDAYEGFDPSHRAAENAYLRRTIEVTGTDGTVHSNVWCYFVQQPHGHIPPSALYGHALLAGARERHLPPNYIKTLSALLRPDNEN
jgi:gamma-glutamylcyclotransferase (GGCT)/AIG2-like uncharacterized protein YtfP